MVENMLEEGRGRKVDGGRGLIAGRRRGGFRREGENGKGDLGRGRKMRENIGQCGQTAAQVGENIHSPGGSQKHRTAGQPGFFLGLQLACSRLPGQQKTSQLEGREDCAG
jgi:hypothetical protein